MPLREAFRPSPPVDVNEFINNAKFKPGLSEDFIALNKEINKNIKYVLGSADQDHESKKEEPQDNKTEDNDNA